ncbi:MAG TPA: hypothetical protein H9774_03840 [Candidatus Desulfovibrio gallistercoris]|uniref:hypothetical protein n=1 Tax=uncultured Desulfovibrio sp. TaxID=167968 RepID=UPI001F9AA4D7|nr:hypothetical protein [uncultured Desulfovibrio sp.]HJA75985.1 hypothetical protein [Candidatus Desulfovibrio gallistercoris]
MFIISSLRRDVRSIDVGCFPEYRVRHGLSTSLAGAFSVRYALRSTPYACRFGESVRFFHSLLADGAVCASRFTVFKGKSPYAGAAAWHKRLGEGEPFPQTQAEQQKGRAAHTR